MNAHFDPSKRLGEYHKQTTPAIWEHQSNPPTRWIGRAWSKSLISARRPWALKGKPRRTPISDTQCLTLNRDRDYELPAVFNFSFSCVKIHISCMSMLTLVFAKEDSRYIWKLQCSDIMRPFWRKVLPCIVDGEDMWISAGITLFRIGKMSCRERSLTLDTIEKMPYKSLSWTFWISIWVLKISLSSRSSLLCFEIYEVLTDMLLIKLFIFLKDGLLLILVVILVLVIPPAKWCMILVTDFFTIWSVSTWSSVTSACTD